MKADDLHINEEERFSIGVDRDTGKYYLSFPVHNRLCGYEEFYLMGVAYVAPPLMSSRISEGLTLR